MAKHEDPTEARRDRLTDNDKMNMLATFTRHKDAMLTAAERTPEELFDPGSRHFEIYWRTLCEYYAKHNEMPRKAAMTSALSDAVDEVGDLDDDEFQQIDDTVSMAFKGKRSDLSTTVALTQFRQLLEEKLVRDLHRKLSSDRTPVDFAGMLSAAKEQAAAIGSLDSGDIEEPFAKDWKPQAVKKTPTGLSFVDVCLGGGDVDGEVYGLLGPVGSCKTTLAVQLSTSGAFRDYAEWEAGGQKEPLKITYHFNWEGPIDAIKQRALCCTAMIDKDILLAEDFEEKLNRKSGILRPYEHELLKGLIKSDCLPTEWKRYLKAKKRLNQNWRVIDMSGNDKRFAGRGTGMIGEIVEIISRDLESLKRQRGYDVRCGLVMADYVSMACERAMAVSSARHEDADKAMRRAVGRFVQTAKNDLATALMSRVWLLQQLNGDANALAPGRLPKRTDSKDNRMFAENLDFCFMIGNPDHSNLAAFGTDKQRREARRPPDVIRILGNLGTVVAAKGYVIDPTTSKFVQSADRERIADAGPMSQHRTKVKHGYDKQLMGE